MSRYSSHPIEKQYLKWEMDRQRSRNEYWVMLKRARNDYYNLTEEASAQFGITESDFYYYMQRNYGVKVNLVDGKIDASYQIVDDKKHMLFIMKYSS